MTRHAGRYGAGHGVGHGISAGARGADMTISQGDFIPGIFIFIYRGEIYLSSTPWGIVTQCTYPRTIIAQYMRDSADFDPRFIKPSAFIIYILHKLFSVILYSPPQST
jgi:hypothetical protein